ncbi:hypothetical protein LTR86_006228 [Recurvomyces mirabilis]|nr:hypothetical protein LTR86_006228 [Recurvomyces mirabilis]
MSRTTSVAGSDRFSVVSGLTANYFSANPQNVNPAPAYVAPFGAKQVVIEHRGATLPPSSDNEDDTADKDDLQFSEHSLALINTFLDQLLFSFLSTARSTSLLALKPAVNDVLKSKLARDAIRSADEELHELLAGGDEDEENNAKQNTAEQRRKWDLELVWKRTRLRVMVYMRLGEMEDEDEERYVKEEELFHGNEKRFSQSTGLVSWAAAIFLTGVLEYIAEQTLQAAGNAAYTRVRRQTLSGRSMSPEEKQAPVIVEEHDVDKCALNPTLGRIWRTWRKLLRSNSTTLAHQRSAMGRLSSESFGRTPSVVEGVEESVDGEPTRPIMLEDVPEMDFPEHVLASNIPLPMSDRRLDVDEIEVPGLAHDPDNAHSKDRQESSAVRRNSFTLPKAYRMDGGLPTPNDSSPEDGISNDKPALLRRRSNSVPTPIRTPLSMDLPGAFPIEEEPVAEAKAAQEEGIAESANVEDGRDEQKADATAMTPHKRYSVGAKELFDKVIDGAPPEETDAQHEKSEHHGLIGGAVAAASAAAAGAAALVYSRKSEDQASPINESRPETATSEQRSRDAAPSAASSRSTRDMSYAEFENNKSLMDMKSLLATGQVSARRRAETPPQLGRTSSDASRTSYNLNNGQNLPQQSPAKRQHINNSMQEDFVLPPGGLLQQQVRGDWANPRPERLVLPGTPPKTVVDRGLAESPSVKRYSPNFSHNAVTESGLSGLPSQRSQTRRISQPPLIEQDRAPRQPHKRRSIPGIALSSAAATPISERNPHRQSWSAAIQAQRDSQMGGRPLSVPAVPSMPFVHKSVPMEPMPVQEHPVVQRMASLKRNQHKIESTAEQPERSLTSASIRGPEDFDMFVQGVETVKYTLTPETVRDLPVQTAPVELSSAPSVSRRRHTNPDNEEGERDVRTGRSSTVKQATAAIPADRYTDDERAARERKRRSVSKPPPRNTSAHRRSGLMAREPRVLTESTQDFADFIRSTGPSREQDVKPILNPAAMSTTSLHSLRSAHINGAGSRASSVASQDRTRSMTKAIMQSENVPPVPIMPAVSSKASKSTLQARAATSNGQPNSELIDFIRTGPSQDGEHRISRSVAPFRNTMDSDQLQPMGEQLNATSSRPQGLKLDTNVGASGPAPKSAGAKSHRSGRRPGESNAAQTVHPAHSGQPQHLSSAATTPKSATAPAVEALPGSRKRMRNKDPYAIDMDDEDDDLLTALPKNKRQEESLMDFLNNNEPPTDNAPRPIVTGNNAQARTLLNKPRTGSINSLRNAANGGDGRTRSSQSNGGPRPGSQNGRPGSSATMNSISRPKMEAKSPGDGSKDATRFGAFSKESNTKELTEFFKNSAPDGKQGPGANADDDGAPAPNINRRSKLNPKDAAKVQKKVEQDSLAGQGRKKGFFSKAKKSWLNMP